MLEQHQILGTETERVFTPFIQNSLFQLISQSLAQEKHLRICTFPTAADHADNIVIALMCRKKQGGGGHSSQDTLCAQVDNLQADKSAFSLVGKWISGVCDGFLP